MTTSKPRPKSRSLHHKRAEHSGGTNRFLTGYSSRQANLNDSEYPDIGSVVAKELEPLARDVPLYVANTKAYGSGPAYLGAAYAPYMPAPSTLTSTGANTYDPVPIYSTNRSVDNLSITSDGVVALRRRHELLKSLDTLPRALDQSGMMSAMDVFHQRALAMLAGSRTREAFDLSREDPRTRERYGQTHWGTSLLTCRRLVEAGVRFVQCQATFRLRKETGRTSNWDDHSVNSHIFNAYREKMPSFDQSVSALIEDLVPARAVAARAVHLLRRVRPHAAHPLSRRQQTSRPRSLAAGHERVPLRRRVEHGPGHRRHQPPRRRAGQADHEQQLPASHPLPPLRHRPQKRTTPTTPAAPSPSSTTANRSRSWRKATAEGNVPASGGRKPADEPGG